MNTDLRKKSKIILGKAFCKLMNKGLFGKAMKNVRKHRPNTCNNNKKSYLASELNYHTTFFSENMLTIEIIKTQILLNTAF